LKRNRPARHPPLSTKALQVALVEKLRQTLLEGTSEIELGVLAVFFLILQI
jgi:hypothetical protein